MSIMKYLYILTHAIHATCVTGDFKICPVKIVMVVLNIICKNCQLPSQNQVKLIKEKKFK